MNRTFYIAGVQFRPKGDISIAGAKLKTGDVLTLISEPTNRFDPNAVQIFTNYHTGNIDNYFIGYVPKKFSSEVAALLEVGIDLKCIVEAVDAYAKTYEMFKVTIKEIESDMASDMTEEGDH